MLVFSMSDPDWNRTPRSGRGSVMLYPLSYRIIPVPQDSSVTICGHTTLS